MLGTFTDIGDVWHRLGDLLQEFKVPVVRFYFVFFAELFEVDPRHPREGRQRLLEVVFVILRDDDCVLKQVKDFSVLLHPRDIGQRGLAVPLRGELGPAKWAHLLHHRIAWRSLE